MIDLLLVVAIIVLVVIGYRETRRLDEEFRKVWSEIRKMIAMQIIHTNAVAEWNVELRNISMRLKEMKQLVMRSDL